jgi:hypothetical protein
MGLINLKTNLKSLKFGHDKPSGGSSNQPYFPQSILDEDITLNNNNPDFLLRGGILAPVNSVVDALRLGKFFTDSKSPAGLFFVLKQELLSRVAVRTQASGKLLNEGIYNPLSTIAQAGVNAFGIHLNKQGLNPIAGSAGSIRTYSEAVANEESGAIDVIRNFATGIIENVTGINLKPNRLVELMKVKITGEAEGYFQNGIISLKSDRVNLMTYPGGPGSILGIGSTNIKLVDGKQRTGINNVYSKGAPNYLAGIKGSPTQRSSKAISPLGASNMYDYYYLNNRVPFGNGEITLNDDVLGGHYKANPLDPKASSNWHFGTAYKPENPQESLQLNKDEIVEAFGGTYRYTAVVTDFRKVVRDRIKDNKTLVEKAKTVLSNSPDYDSGKAIESRVFIGDPGGKGRDLTSYTNGYNGSGSSSPNSFDRITALPLYRSNAVDTTKPVRDLVKFRIAAIDNDEPEQKVFMHFRAFLGSISDNYNADHNSVRYPGRAEEFFTYEGFSRKVSLSFVVAAQSKQELIPMYKKLNYLASQLAPDYSKFGYMRGPLIQLTVGGYFYEQVGILNNLTFDITEETPWEIGIDDTGDYDPSVKELPHIIKVSSFSFTPIHSFIPRKAKWDDLGKTPFIALTNGANSNY